MDVKRLLKSYAIVENQAESIQKTGCLPKPIRFTGQNKKSETLKQGKSIQKVVLNFPVEKSKKLKVKINDDFESKNLKQKIKRIGKELTDFSCVLNQQKDINKQAQIARLNPLANLIGSLFEVKKRINMKKFIENLKLVFEGRQAVEKRMFKFANLLQNLINKNNRNFKVIYFENFKDKIKKASIDDFSKTNETDLEKNNLTELANVFRVFSLLNKSIQSLKYLMSLKPKNEVNLREKVNDFVENLHRGSFGQVEQMPGKKVKKSKIEEIEEKRKQAKVKMNQIKLFHQNKKLEKVKIVEMEKVKEQNEKKKMKKEEAYIYKMKQQKLEEDKIESQNNVKVAQNKLNKTRMRFVISFLRNNLTCKNNLVLRVTKNTELRGKKDFLKNWIKQFEELKKKRKSEICRVEYLLKTYKRKRFFIALKNNENDKIIVSKNKIKQIRLKLSFKKLKTKLKAQKVHYFESKETILKKRSQKLLRFYFSQILEYKNVETLEKLKLKKKSEIKQEWESKVGSWLADFRSKKQII